MNSYMYKREMERKSLEVSCVLRVKNLGIPWISMENSPWNSMED